MCWNGAKGQARGWSRSGRVRGLHVIFTSQGTAADTTTVTTTDTTE
jgi:hypothetical protein